MNFVIRFSNVLALLIGAALMLAFASLPVRAEGIVCVQCRNPDLTYRCNVLRDDGSPARAAYQFFCIKEIAREGGHQSCSVKRNGNNGGVCEGLEKTLVYGGPVLSAPVNPGMAGNPASGGHIAADDGGVPAPDGSQVNEEGREPQTLIELTDQAAEGTKKQLKKTGNTVSGAVKKTGAAIGGAAKKTGATVVGAVKKTGKVVGGAVKKTGKAVGSAAKSTLTCVTSLFSNCF